MGTDIYQYTALKKTGSVLKVLFQSGQQCGLAPEGDGFWVCALLSHEDAYSFENPDPDADRSFGYYPACSLAKLPRWGELPFEIFPSLLVKNFDTDLYSGLHDHVCSLGIGFSVFSLSNDKLTIQFQTTSDGEAFRKQFHGQAAWAQQDTVLECCNQPLDTPPSVYDLPESVFQSLITSACLDEVHFEDKEYDENDENSYWDTEAVYTLEVADAAYLDHIQEGDLWNGR
ncbi:MAG: uncharacterized protein KVP18_004786 [Porospora cf. gigantea A]|uniref:uncharacterized protein n=1 Tax=Porospora cf. gigantea A TaxID=2853593 RepID=UPI0035597D70|nr:MAG: hypothetical protein KVP18_004786 [Porospora cf. gigantea A]